MPSSVQSVLWQLVCAQLSTWCALALVYAQLSKRCDLALVYAQLSTRYALALVYAQQYKVCSGFSLCPAHDQDKVHSGNLTDTV